MVREAELHRMGWNLFFIFVYGCKDSDVIDSKLTTIRYWHKGFLDYIKCHKVQGGPRWTKVQRGS